MSSLRLGATFTNAYDGDLSIHSFSDRISYFSWDKTLSIMEREKDIRLSEFRNI